MTCLAQRGVVVLNNRKITAVVPSLLLILLSADRCGATCQSGTASRSDAQRIHKSTADIKTTGTRRTVSPRGITAAEALAEGERLRSQGKAAQSRKAIGKYLTAAVLLRAKGDLLGEALALKTVADIHDTLGDFSASLRYYNRALLSIQDRKR